MQLAAPLAPVGSTTSIRPTVRSRHVTEFGGQTALNCGCALEKSGVLSKFNCRVMGTPVDAILASESRDGFEPQPADAASRPAALNAG